MSQISDRLIAETIRLGGMDRGFPGMPATLFLTRAELVTLVAFVRSLSDPDVATIDPKGFE